MASGDVTRREFLKGTALGVAGLALGGSTALAAPEVTREAKVAKSVVAIARSEKALDASFQVNKEECAQLLHQAVWSATGTKSTDDAWKAMFKPTDIVGIITSKAVNPTHLELADIIKADLIAAGVPEANMKVTQRDIEVVKQCTALIALPGLKAHWLTGIGTVMKLYIMYSGKPAEYHNEDSAKLGEIWNLDFMKGKTRLVIVDALRPTCDKGPQVDPRYQWAYNGIIASVDPVAADAVSLKILQAKRNAIKGESWPLTPPPTCVEAADKQYGLGKSDLAKIEIKKLGWSEGALV